LADPQSQNPQRSAATPAVLLNRFDQIQPKFERNIVQVIFAWLLRCQNQHVLALPPVLLSFRPVQHLFSFDEYVCLSIIEYLSTIYKHEYQYKIGAAPAGEILIAEHPSKRQDPFLRRDDKIFTRNDIKYCGTAQPVRSKFISNNQVLSCISSS